MGGDGQPAAPAPGPHIRVPAGAASAVGLRIGRPRVDDGDVPEEAHLDVMGLEIRDPDRLRGLPEEAFAIDQRSVGIRTAEVVRQDLVEARNVRVLHRTDVVVVEAEQDLD